MRMRRFKAGTDRSAVYHCMTRTVNGMRLFEDADKEMLRRMLWKVAEFSGVEVLTYCLLANHFHVLVRVAEKREIADSELIRRCRVLYPKEPAFKKHQPGSALRDDPAATLESMLSAGGPEAETLRRSLQKRMGDVSEFMKTLKQRFTIWFNHTHGRYGTLWAERFKSVLVESDRFALATVAAYIDLNPIRAGLVEDPKDYRFCGYGEALGEGGKRIRDGLKSVLGCSDWTAVLRDYRMILFGKGATAKRDGTEGGEIPWEEAAKILNAGGRLPLSIVLRCRVRYFTDGVVLGSGGFVAEALRQYQKVTGRRTRQRNARPLAGADWEGLTTMRGLRRAVFG